MTQPATVNLADGITWDDVMDIENPDSLTLEGTTLSFTQVRDDSQILVKGNGKVHIQGGVHVNPRIRAGATVEGAAQIEITGNVFTHYLSTPRVTPSGTSSISLRGFWGASAAGFTGNLGLDFDVVEIDTQHLEHHLEYQASEAWTADKTTPDTPIPSVIFRAMLVSYQLPHFFNFTMERAKNVYLINAFEVACNVLNKATEIRQFCAHKDAHTRPNCRCALYQSLLITGDAMATAYHLQAMPALQHLTPSTLQDVPVRALEDLLEEKLLTLARTSPERKPLWDSMINNALTKDEFTEHVKQFGFSNPEALWNLDADPNGVWDTAVS